MMDVFMVRSQRLRPASAGRVDGGRGAASGVFSSRSVTVAVLSPPTMAKAWCTPFRVIVGVRVIGPTVGLDSDKVQWLKSQAKSLSGPVIKGLKAPVPEVRVKVTWWVVRESPAKVQKATWPPAPLSPLSILQALSIATAGEVTLSTSLMAA